jgi:hypothetical protein
MADLTSAFFLLIGYSLPVGAADFGRNLSAIALAD